MKSRPMVAVFLAAVLSVAMTATTFARSGMSGNGSMGGVRGNGGAFHDTRQGMSGPMRGEHQQDRMRSGDQIHDPATDRLRERDRSGEEVSGAGGPQRRGGEPIGAGDRGATPATPAEPGSPGTPATPAVPAAPN